MTEVHHQVVILAPLIMCLQELPLLVEFPQLITGRPLLQVGGQEVNRIVAIELLTLMIDPLMILPV